MPDLPAFNDGPVVGTFTPLAPGSSDVNGPGTLASVDQFLVGAQAELTAAATSVQQIGEQVEADAAAAIERIDVSVRVSGALAGTGEDASAYLQEQINFAASRVQNGFVAEVVMPDGVFALAEMLRLPNGVNLRGGRNTVLDVSGVPMLTAILAIGTQGTRVQDIKIVGSGQGSQPINGSGLTHDEIASRVRLAGCGIIFAGVTRGIIRGCIIENCGGTTGALPFNGVAGIWLTYGCTYTTVITNNVTNNRNGINEDNFFGPEPKHNKIVFNNVVGGRFGIALDSGATATDTMVIGNSIESCQQSGIDLNKANRCFVGFNYIFGCGIQNGNSGIFIYGTSNTPVLYVKCVHNIIVSCLGHGIKIGPFAYFSQVEGNHCITNIKNGILAQGIFRECSISLNFLIGNRENGLRVFRPSDDPNAVITTNKANENTIFQNWQNGILVEAGSEFTFANNTIKDNSQEPTAATFTASISGSVMTVTDVAAGTLTVGLILSGTNVQTPTQITALGTGTGGTGTYTVGTPQTVAETTIAGRIGYDGVRLTQATQDCTITGGLIAGLSHRYAIAGTDSGTQDNGVHGVKVLPGVLGRMGFANWRQSWAGNFDQYLTTSGPPAGRWPDGFTYWSNGNQTRGTQLSDGTWKIEVTRTGVTTRGDVNLALDYNSQRPVQYFNSTLTADRTVTLNLPTIVSGAKFRIVRTALAGGAFALNIVTNLGVTLKAMTAGTWVDVEYDEGSALWRVTGAGSL